MKNTLLFLLVLLPLVEVGAEPQKAIPTWSALATRPKPTGMDFEKQFRNRYKYLVSKEFCTRVPRQSILHLPDQYREMVADAPQGRQVSWIEFLSANKSWLRHSEVTWSQVLAKQPLAKELRENFEKHGCLVIATYQGGPVTVLPFLDKSVDSKVMEVASE
ncbi:hypothetical protein AAFN60_04575 [Roseibacillus persicicus]|uniref:hypothetical protein n=1 Tax=Roseibacillus persicicus TaxID=454148 RepID=UPI00398ABE5D